MFRKETERGFVRKRGVGADAPVGTAADAASFFIDLFLKTGFSKVSEQLRAFRYRLFAE